MITIIKCHKFLWISHIIDLENQIAHIVMQISLHFTYINLTLQYPVTLLFCPHAPGYENEPRVVALGTGSKCIGKKKMNKEGM